MRPLSKAQKDALLKVHRLGRAGVRWPTAEVLQDRGLIDREAYSQYWTLTPTGQVEAEAVAREVAE